MYIGKKLEDFKKDFSSTEIFLRHQKPNFIKWQQAWQNRIADYFRAQRSAHGSRMRASSFAACPQKWRRRFRWMRKHSMRGSKTFIRVQCQSKMCTTIRQSVAMHTTKRKVATYEYLEGLLDDAERAKSMLPVRKQLRGGRATASAAAAAFSAGGGGTEDNAKSCARR